MTDDSNKISNSAPSPDTELWLSQTELAEMKGVTRQTIWEKVTRLEQDGLLATRPGAHGTKLVPVAEYDRLVGETTDFARQRSAETRALEAAGADAPLAAGDMRFTDAQRRKMQYEAGLKQLEYGERSRQLVAVADVKRVVEQISEVCRGGIEALMLQADEIAAAGAKDGTAGVRIALKDAGFKLLTAIVQALRMLETESRAQDGAGVEIDLEMPDEQRS